MIRINKVTKDTKSDDMRFGTIIIIVGDMQVEADSSKIRKSGHEDQSSATHALKKVIDMQTVHTKIKPISSFVPVMVLVITL